MQEEARESLGAWALFCRDRDGHTEWLARWNGHWNCYNFVGGHKHEDETFRECVVREIHEEVGLREQEDYTISPDDALLHLEYEAWSRSAQQDTRYVVELFGIALNEDKLAEHLATERPIRWLTHGEIQDGRTCQGEPVSETIKRMLSALPGEVKGSS